MLTDYHIYHKQIQFLKSLSLILFLIAGYKNGMVLCPNRHTFFDDMLNPGWIFIPSNLDCLIDYELENCKTCQNLQDCAVPECHEYLSHCDSTESTYISERSTKPIGLVS